MINHLQRSDMIKEYPGLPVICVVLPAFVRSGAPAIQVLAFMRRLTGILGKAGGSRREGEAYTTITTYPLILFLSIKLHVVISLKRSRDWLRPTPLNPNDKPLTDLGKTRISSLLLKRKERCPSITKTLSKLLRPSYPLGTVSSFIASFFIQRYNFLLKASADLLQQFCNLRLEGSWSFLRE